MKLKPIIKKCFSEVLKFSRNEREISKKELAEKAGLHRNEISFLERGERVPSLETIIKIADGLEMDANEFMKEFFEKFKAEKDNIS